MYDGSRSWFTDGGGGILNFSNVMYVNDTNSIVCTNKVYVACLWWYIIIGVRKIENVERKIEDVERKIEDVERAISQVEAKISAVEEDIHTCERYFKFHYMHYTYSRIQRLYH